MCHVSTHHCQNQLQHFKSSIMHQQHDMTTTTITHIPTIFQAFPIITKACAPYIQTNQNKTNHVLTQPFIISSKSIMYIKPYITISKPNKILHQTFSNDNAAGQQHTTQCHISTFFMTQQGKQFIHHGNHTLTQTFTQLNNLHPNFFQI